MSDREHDYALVEEIDTRGSGLTEWEFHFVDSCQQRLDRGYALTTKQRDRLDDIYAARVAS